MKAQDKKALAEIVHNYPIRDVLKVLTEVINDQVDELVDLSPNMGHSGLVKDMSLAAHHLEIFVK